MNTKIEPVSNPPFFGILLFLLAKAEISPCHFCVTTEQGRIVITQDFGETAEDEEDEDEPDPIFNAMEYILEHADDEALKDVLNTIESEMAERGLI
jgi:hypothetical protein